MTSMVTFSVRIEKEVKDALDKAAEDDDRKPTAYLRLMLTRHLQETGYLPKKKKG
ncbi:MAG: hypothetical protein MI755_17425 [Sphingomonadales bacterium]|nr:hypothetical protein [Sphingomonadales bacterium]